MRMDKLGPYELNSIITGDAQELLAALPAACIDLTVTSPPYDNLRDYKGYTFDFKPIAFELFRVTKQGGVVVWVVGDATISGSETGTSFRQALKFMELGFNLHDTMVYEKLQSPYGSTKAYLQCFEFMFVFCKGSLKTHNLIRDRKNIQVGRSTALKEGRRNNGELPGRVPVTLAKLGRRKNIWQYATGGKQDIGNHPAIFPEALARDHIISWSNPDDVVLDPMCGSGTTCKMAKQLGRRWIGFDIAEEYVRLARQRVEQTNPPLFTI